MLYKLELQFNDGEIYEGEFNELTEILKLLMAESSLIGIRIFHELMIMGYFHYTMKNGDKIIISKEGVSKEKTSLKKTIK